MSSERLGNIEFRPELNLTARNIETLSGSPAIVAIYTSPGTGEPMVSHTEIEATAGEGLVGDRYNSGDNMRRFAGFYRDRRIPNTDRQITLITTEGIKDGNEFLGTQGKAPILPEQTRRNLVVRMGSKALNDLVGRNLLLEECSWKA